MTQPPTSLEPCPFCRIIPEVMPDDGRERAVWHQNIKCPLSNLAIPIENWNIRSTTEQPRQDVVMVDENIAAWSIDIANVFSIKPSLKEMADLENVLSSIIAIVRRDTQLSNRAQLMESTLMKIANFKNDCGCRPCAGQCRSKEALEIILGNIIDAATEALSSARKTGKA